MQAGSIKSKDQTFLNHWLLPFFLFYFFVFIFPFPINYLPFIKVASHWYDKIFGFFIAWTGRHIFHLSFPLAPVNSGSSDTTYNYIQLFLSVALAMVITIVWNVTNLKKKDNGVILHWIMIYIRYFFAITMIRYGLEKIIKMQFPFPFYSLNETYGESSPLRLFVTFMGYSRTYNFFIGAGEIITGILVLFKKTTTLGALLGLAILSNVVMLNFCFDGSVKLYATHLLVIALFIAAPDTKRLFIFFIQNKSAPAANIQPRFQNQNVNTIWYAAKFLLTLCIVYSLIGIVRQKYYFYGDGAFAKTPLFGIYRVETFVKNNDTLQPLLTDATQWKMLNIIYSKQATIKMMDDSLKVCTIFIDTTKKKMQLVDDNDSTYKVAFSYTKQDSVHLAVIGKIKEDSVYILLQKQNINQYELLNRGFHWINESPYKK